MCDCSPLADFRDVDSYPPFTHRRRFYYDKKLAENVADRYKLQEKRSGVFISTVWLRQGLRDREALRSRYAYFEHVQNKRSGIVANKNCGKVVKRA
jgi:hypothetical protein